MKVLFCTIIGMLFCAASGNCQHQGRVVVCEFEVPRIPSPDQLGEKIKIPLTPSMFACIVAESAQYDYMLQLPYDKNDKKKPLIKITDFVKSKNTWLTIPNFVKRQVINPAQLHTTTTRLAVLQANANVAFRQKVNGRNKPEPPKENRPVILPQTFL